MKNFLLFCIILGTAFTTSAQNKSECGTDALHNHKMATDTVYAQRMHDFDANTYASRQATAVNGVHVIPVVVHVMHKGEPLGTGVNITDEQIRQQIKSINERFRKVTGTAGDGNGADVTIEFALAVRDPDGNCTSGITRTNMSNIALYMNSGVKYDAAGSGITDGALKALDYWDSNQYYNMWVVSEFDNGESIFAGYAYYASAHGLAYDGAVMLSEYFADANSTVTTHELGHAFNLYHTFEGDGGGTTCPSVINGCGNGLGDCCADTAPHVRYTDCNTTATNSCNPENTNLNYKRNYMTYTVASGCLNMFSNDQKTRALLAATAVRGSLLAANGNMSLVPAALPQAAFTLSGSAVCLNNTIKLSDASSCIPNTYLDTTTWDNLSFTWTVTNGTNTYVYTDQNAYFTPTFTGLYDVSLAVTANNNTVVTSRAGAIAVAQGITAVPCTPFPGQTGNFALVINEVKFNSINNTTSGTVNGGYQNYTCTNATTVVAGATYPLTLTVRAGSTQPEAYSVYIDYNNNGTFQANELVMQGSMPATQRNTIVQNVSIPANAVQNTLLTMRVIGEAGTISPAEVSCATGFFVADIEDYGVYITSPMNTDNVVSQAAITLMPNPATTAFTLSSAVTIDSIVMYNMLGQMVMQKNIKAANATVDVSSLSAGAYIIQATSNGKISTHKVIKN